MSIAEDYMCSGKGRKDEVGGEVHKGNEGNEGARLLRCSLKVTQS
jgi:hypothetical protein